MTAIRLSKLTFAGVDQASTAGANFLASILLARWLEPQQYGAYALGVSVYSLLATISDALITEPMMILGPS